MEVAKTAFTIDDDFCNWIASGLNYHLLSSMESSEITESNDDDDFCNSILSQFGNSSDEDDQLICTIIVAMSKSLKEKKVPSSPVAYLYATCSSLDNLEPPDFLINALFTILSLVIVRVPFSVLKKKKEYLSKLVLRILQYRLATKTSIILGLKWFSYSLTYTDEFSSDALLELLTSFALSISSNEMPLSGDGMTFTVRLLDAGINKVYSLNKQICVSELPTFFNALKDVLTSQHEEAICAATTALKNIINSCIDETLIKQGVDIITLEENKKSRTSGPTIIEKICATIESLLDHIYVDVWDRVFEVVSSMFHKLGSYSPYLMRGILKNLEYMQKLPDEDFPFRKQLHVCLESALVAMGPENLPSFVHNLYVEAEYLSEANIR
ncbi:hypothetical protein TSUD_108200 [Trifolium subterraneum]|uniref:Uncharacterized protein n=1 Tax=Trifolium subterraneum TaxID=3900 RepID=A0A2Z6N6P1_TRISU|nr:hypothetical protein TSUD_108200 [Trifolium subterraneum]